ncbi:hypothetical protein JGU66_33235 [Myxococcaceae bacterium JPH2]|nr:hypothetical protein [Myxococcaceae bacterium JPH2]
MLYGDEKSFEMSRSLLPSTARQEARQRRARVSRANRRESRLRMARVLRDEAFAEDCSELSLDSSREMAFVVSDRRHSDKVNPFIHWAIERTRDIPRDSRRTLVRSLVPPGVIGFHAVFHLQSESHFLGTSELRSDEAERAHRSHRGASTKPMDRGLVVALLRQLLKEPDGHRILNGYIKQSARGLCVRLKGADHRYRRVYQGGESPRVLLGAHDIDAFVDALFGRPGDTKRYFEPASPRSAQAARMVLSCFHQHQKDMGATLAALPPLSPQPVAR